MLYEWADRFAILAAYERRPGNEIHHTYLGCLVGARGIRGCDRADGTQNAASGSVPLDRLRGIFRIHRNGSVLLPRGRNIRRGLQTLVRPG